MDYLRLTAVEVTLKYIDIIQKADYLASMKNGDHKYLTLTGSPLHVPLWKTFHKTAGVKVGVGFSAFSVTADAMTNGGSNFYDLAPMILTIPFINAFNRMTETALVDQAFGSNLLRIPFKPDGKPLAINTQPPAYLRTPDDLITKAKKARHMAFGMVAAFGSVSAFAIGAVINYASVLKDAPVVVVVGAGHLIVPTIATFAACAYRFNKVVKGDYVIVDAPPKKKPEDVKEASGFGHEPSPI